MQMYGGMEVWFHAFLTLALDGGEWLTPHPNHFTSEEITQVLTG
jgi:hypothetical protein